MAAFPTDPNTLKVQEYLESTQIIGDIYKIAGVVFLASSAGNLPWPLCIVFPRVGSIFRGGWLPKKLINGGMDANKAARWRCSSLPCSR
jgi:hypothetical protein